MSEEVERTGNDKKCGEADDDAIVIFVTHKAAPADVAHALSRFEATGVLVGHPVAIRIEEL